MMLMIRSFILALLILAISADDKEKGRKERRFRKRDLKGASSGSFDRGRSGLLDDEFFDDDLGGLGIARDTLTITLKITNLTYKQPFGPLFVMVHNADAIPIFTLGDEPRQTLQILAENGDPEPMAEAYADGEGVFFSGIYTEGSPWGGGMDIFVTLPYRPLFPYLTIAGMALNTNDGFVALNGVRIIPNLVITGPMYDAGSEVNNEQCAAIPGSACDDDDNVRAGNGEGFVHVHRGIFGIADLKANEYDWKNPVMRVEMMNPFT
ncbi:Spondin_N [Seminavis robusta]|uniref:Spondin_N n=1 Tax=Seminavis robusta TaxID=568900 RepID=A0A9N8DCR8_9STRA|nr:Spondin_N [Seminavis robusta]|eukprot:Sro87_g046020.1 Spondin_N (265) ;mRNA; f:43309-44103